MNAPPITIAFIDDEFGKALPEYERALSSLGAELQPLEPPSQNEDWDLLLPRLEQSDLVLIDHNLLTQVAYDGGMLSVRLRSRLPLTPLVLATRTRFDEPGSPPQLLESDFLTPGEAHVVDEVMYREELEAHQGVVQSLIEGYRDLRAAMADKADGEVIRSMGLALELLKAENSETGELRTAGLAVHSGDVGRPASWDAQDFVTWVRHVLFRYPGPLLDERHAATTLGLTTESFQSDSIQDIIRGSQYSGVFSGPEQPLWWRSRLRRIADDYVDVHLDPTAERLALSFPRALETSRLPFTPAYCEWDRSLGVDTVCYVSGNPVKLEHSLGYRPDQRPPGMEEARVSFRSIRERNDYDERLFSSAGQKELARIIDDLPDPLDDMATGTE